MYKKNKVLFSSADVKFMRLALKLAQKGLGRTSPNPAVGAVIVKNGKIVGRGYHKKAGSRHAEIEALNSIKGVNLKDAVMYVTLEPCCHTKKRTPPCTKALIKSGLKQIVIATRDPNKMVAGKGIKELLEAGFSVKEGLLAEEAERLNEVYIRNITSKSPFVVLKMALSIDGMIAGEGGKRISISCTESQKMVHLLRNIYDGVLTTSTTVLADNPHLGVRYVKGRDPLRIILDRALKTDVNAKVYRDKNVIVLTTIAAKKKKIAKFKEKGIRMIIYHKWPPLKAILANLRNAGIYSLLVEVGAKMSKSLIREKLTDKCIFFIAPDIVGSKGLKAFVGRSNGQILGMPVMKKMSFALCGRDMVVEGYM